jgi:hypothetical protein
VKKLSVAQLRGKKFSLSGNKTLMTEVGGTQHGETPAIQKSEGTEEENVFYNT